MNTVEPIISDDYFACPSCGNKELYFRQLYCDCCGRKIIWSENDIKSILLEQYIKEHFPEETIEKFN